MIKSRRQFELFGHWDWYRNVCSQSHSAEFAEGHNKSKRIPFCQHALLNTGITYLTYSLFTDTLSPECHHIDGSVQERRNPSALAMELRLSCTKPSIWFVATLPHKQNLLFDLVMGKLCAVRATLAGIIFHINSYPYQTQSTYDEANYGTMIFITKCDFETCCDINAKVAVVTAFS